MKLIIPIGSRVTEIVHSNGSVFVNVVLKNGKPKTIRQL